MHAFEDRARTDKPGAAKSAVRSRPPPSGRAAGPASLEEIISECPSHEPTGAERIDYLPRDIQRRRRRTPAPPSLEDRRRVEIDVRGRAVGEPYSTVHSSRRDRDAENVRLPELRRWTCRERLWYYARWTNWYPPLNQCRNPPPWMVVPLTIRGAEHESVITADRRAWRCRRRKPKAPPSHNPRCARDGEVR